MMLLKLLMISTFKRVPLLVADVANVQERLVVVTFVNYALAGFFSHKLEKEQKIGMNNNKVPEFSNILLSNGPIRPVPHKVPEFSNSVVLSGGPVRPAPLKVPEFSNNLGCSGPARPASPVFSIVTISWPTAVDNFYEDVENPYGLKNSKN